MTSGSGFAYERYRTTSSTEWMMRVGPKQGLPVLIVPPLFEEMNRMRAALVAVMRALAERGCRCTLPDLPGTGESTFPLERFDWNLWRGAIAEAGRAAAAGATQGRLLVASFRGGCLLDDAVDAATTWRLAPVAGASLARDLIRSTLLHTQPETAAPRLLAGYPVPAGLLSALEAAIPSSGSSIRTVRLEGDPAPADATIAGPALWRRSEPSNSPELSDLISSDIMEWSRLCAAS